MATSNTTPKYLTTDLGKRGILDKLVSWAISLVGRTAVNAVETSTDVAIQGAYRTVAKVHSNKKYLEGIATLVEDLD